MLDRHHHVARVEMLVVEDFSEVADGPGRDLVRLEDLYRLRRGALANPFLKERVDLLAVGTTASRARIEPRIGRQLRAAERAQNILPVARGHGGDGDPPVASAVDVEGHRAGMRVAAPLRLAAGHDELEDVGK